VRSPGGDFREETTKEGWGCGEAQGSTRQPNHEGTGEGNKRLWVEILKNPRGSGPGALRTNFLETIKKQNRSEKKD